MPTRHHNSKQLKEAGLTEDGLLAIENDFIQKSTDYEQTAQYVTNVLLKTSGVHSVRYRVKNPRHLSQKILRKKLENKERILTLDTYEQEITDLAGIRILHLFKNDWQDIHQFIMSTWELKEPPTAYYRQGDPDDFLQMFEGCEIKEHPKGYRSVHYIIETSPTKAKRYLELQVRTIFEEAWSEIDHTIRYPNFSDDPLTNNLLMILNRLAGSADEMSSFVQQLSSHLVASQAQYAELDRKREELQKIIDKTTSAEDKSTLQTWADIIKHLPTASETGFDPSAGSAGIFAHSLLPMNHWFQPRHHEDHTNLKSDEVKNLSKRMVSFIEHSVNKSNSGEPQLTAPISLAESLLLYQNLLSAFPDALDGIPAIKGQVAVAAVANSFLKKIGRTK